MTKRNPNFNKLSSIYLFPEINRRKKAFLEQYPEAALISLGIGDTTEPLPPSISNAISEIGSKLGTREGYSGYGPEQGQQPLRHQISEVFYQGKISEDDIFISDGAKCDIGRLQQLFGNDVSMAVQDPAYPVYIDGSMITGVNEVSYLPCIPSNHFWPDLKKTKRTDLIYFCSPNNPTGTVVTFSQLEELVKFAKKNKSIIIFDAAYAQYIQDDKLPKTIYDIPGSKEVAIELGSFSKLAGFSGVRLGWSVVPAELQYEDGSSVKADWKRLTSTIFNGASNVSQYGGLAVLKPEGMSEVRGLIKFYLENVALLRKTLIKLGYEVHGGEHAPYLWVKFPDITSWEAFQMLLEKAHLISTPGSGFGHQGEGFLRLSAFGSRKNILEACERLSKCL